MFGLLQVVLIGIGLAMDAFAVSVSKGLSVQRLRPRHVLCVGLWFGVFQGLMPLLGYELSRRFAHYVENIDHWVAFGLLLLIGVNMIRETLSGDDDDEGGSDFGFRTMLLMAIATSIDAFAVGVSLVVMNISIWSTAAIIALITMLISAIGIYLGAHVGAKIGSKAGVVGGVILIAIGVNILVEHLAV
jgi:putative Mn2+ efflux pump MntP